MQNTSKGVPFSTQSYRFIYIRNSTLVLKLPRLKNNTDLHRSICINIKCSTRRWCVFFLKRDTVYCFQLSISFNLQEESLPNLIFTVTFVLKKHYCLLPIQIFIKTIEIPHFIRVCILKAIMMGRSILQKETSEKLEHIQLSNKKIYSFLLHQMKKQEHPQDLRMQKLNSVGNNLLITSYCKYST